MLLRNKPKSGKRRMKRYVANARRGSVSRQDPSRTGSIYRPFKKHLSSRFDELRAALVELVLTQDSFGLGPQSGTAFNFNPNQPRDQQGQWVHGGGDGVKPLAVGWETPAKVTFTAAEGKEAIVRKAWSSLLPNVSIERAGDLVGAPKDARVLVSSGHESIIISTSHEGYESTRFIYRDSPTTLVCKNDSFLVKDEYQGAGLGTEVFARQVHELQKAGVGKIVTSAERNDPSPIDSGGGSNGYYTWPRLGYDISMTDYKVGYPVYAEKLLKEFPGTISLHDLFKTKEGRQWWKENGRTTRMTFDLTPGSRSMKVLETYLQEKEAGRKSPSTTTNSQPSTGRGIGYLLTPTFNWNPNQTRDEEGRWADTGGGAKGGLLGSLKELGAKAAHVEEVAKSWVSDKVATAVGKLPTPVQKAVTATYYAGKVGTQTAFTTWRMGQELAERVAKEKGATDEQARRLRGLVSALDVTALKPIQVILGASGVGASAIGVVSFVPPATAAYLAYSTARNPMATIRAARSMVRDAVIKGGRGLSAAFTKGMDLLDEAARLTGNVEQFELHERELRNVERLHDVLTKQGYDDRFIALASAAIDELGDVWGGIALAEELYGRTATLNWNPNQPRDAEGQWTRGGSAASQVLARGLASGKEHSIVTDKTGKHLSEDIGDEGSVDLGKHAGASVAGSGLTVFHNHPDNSDFSPGDVKAFAKYPGIDEIVAVTHSGKVQRMRVIGNRDDLYRAVNEYELKVKTTITDKFLALKNPTDAQREELQREKFRLLGMVSDEMAQRGFIIKVVEPTLNASWQFTPNAEKLKLFQAWLKAQLTSLVKNATEEQLWKLYVEQGFKRGAGRAFDDVKGGKKATLPQEKMPWYEGGRDQFLASAFGQPVAVEKVQLLAQQTYDHLEGVTADMSNRMGRVLTDGLVTGKGPREVARTLAQTVELGKQRALVVARTELIRAHSEGQLVALKQLGVTELGVEVEWATGGKNVCPKCAAHNGKVYDIDKASGLIPHHPNCKCTWVPKVPLATTLNSGVRSGRELTAYSLIGPTPELRAFSRLALNMAPNQPRDSHGRWTKFGGGGKGGHLAPKVGNLAKVKDLPGSTGPILAKDEHGTHYVVKKGGHKQDQLRNEELANDLYRAMGIKVPASSTQMTSDNGLIKVSKFIEGGQTLNDWSQGKSKAEVDAMHAKISKDFVADALLANWDVVGLSKDNILIKDGVPYRIDNGGAMKYRAQGGIKHSWHDSGQVLELQTLRDAVKNPSSASVFKGLTDADIQTQIKGVLSKKDAILQAASVDPETHGILKKRLEHLESLVKPTEHVPPTVPLSQKLKTEIGQGSPIQSSSPPTTVGHSPATATHLHTGKALADYFKQKAAEHGVKINDLQLEKLAWANPEGLKSGSVTALKISTNPNDPTQKAQWELLEKILPPGTVVKAKVVTGKTTSDFFFGSTKPKSLVDLGSALAGDTGKGLGGDTASQPTPKPSKVKKLSPSVQKAANYVETLPPGTSLGSLWQHKYGLGVKGKKGQLALLDKLHAAGKIVKTDQGFGSHAYYTPGGSHANMPPVAQPATPKSSNAPAHIVKLKEHSQAAIATLTHEEKMQVINYTVSGYAHLNSEMRKCPPNFECVGGDTKKKMDLMMSAIEKAPPLPEPISVWRGMYLSGSDKQKFVDIAKSHQEGGGATFQLPSFTSTSTKESTAFGGGVKLVIKARTGLYVESISAYPTEKELIQSPKAKYKVMEVHEGPHHVTVHLEEVLDG